jgi:hypothetical protein
MSNLEMINAAFGMNLSIVNPFSGKKRTEAEVLIREANRIGAYWEKPSPSSTTALAYRNPKCLYGLALFLALDGDGPRLSEVCQTQVRLYRIRIRKEEDLGLIRAGRIEDLRRDGLEVLVEGVNERYDIALWALTSAIGKEIEVFVDAKGEVETARETEIGEYWERYFRAENALKESLHSKVLKLRDKFRG